jgi:hypothetical protein
VSDDDVISRALERRPPDPDPRWRSELGAAIAAESHRRAAVRPRPRHLWALAGALIVIGIALLGLALAL